MTRVLSELLGAPEPAFGLQLRQLENSAGRPSADIRLTAEVQGGVQAKLKELGLDPRDTTGRELYTALGARLKDDEVRFTQALQAGAKKTDDPVALVVFGLNRELADRSCLALKNAAAKRILKANLPKRAMKALGYRSADSMLKHESPASLMAAAQLVETEQWTKKLLAAYTKLKATDFEIRKVSIEYPATKKWQTLSASSAADSRHNILTFKELGSVVILPFADKLSRPDLPALTTSVLTLHGINEILAASTFMKLHQMRPNFGSVVRDIVVGEPVLEARLLDQPVSWNLVQQYFGRMAEIIRSDLFEPIVQAEDLVWRSVEQVLARIEPSLGFWQGGGHFGMLHEGKAVSCNLTDQLLSHCNRLPYEQRTLQYLRHQLRTELLLRYMNADTLQQAVQTMQSVSIGVQNDRKVTNKLALEAGV